MNITVCVKQLPDTSSERTLRPADRTVDRAAANAVINELDEFAIEAGLQLTEKLGGEVTILSMGPDRATESIRKALSMGAARGVDVCDEARPGSAARVTSATARSIWSSWVPSRPTPGPGCWPPCWPSGWACPS